MSGTAATVQNEFSAVPVSEVEAVRVSLNKVVDDLESNRRALNVNVTAVGNVGGGEDDLMTYALAAGKFNANLQSVRVRAWGTSANNATAKTLKAYFGTAAVLSQSLTASIAGRWAVEFNVLRTGSNTQDAVAQISEGTAALGAGKFAQEITTPTQTEANSLTIKLTGTGGADNDIVQEGMIVEYVPVAADLTANKVNLR